MKYFIDCKTKDEAKAKYRKLAKKLHPDAGGNQEDMIDLQHQYESFEENIEVKFTQGFNDTIFGSENAFRESIYNKYHTQNQDSPYFRTYTFNSSTANHSGEVNRLRDENTKLRGQLYQYESVIKSKTNDVESLLRKNHLLEMENSAMKMHCRSMTKEIDELRKIHNERILNYPKTPWETIKHLFKQLFESRQDDKTK